MRAVVAPHNPRPSKESVLKPSMRPGGMHDEHIMNEALMRYVGNHLPARDVAFASVTAAIRENEALVAAAREKERATQQQASQQQASYASRYHSRDEKLEQETKAQQEAFQAGSVAYALWQLDRQYSPKRSEKPVERHVLSYRFFTSTISKPTSAPSQPCQRYITREAPTKTVHMCEVGNCRATARYRNYGWWECEVHNAWGPLGR